ncbi:MAG: thiamine pyrophosphate-dependent enzyme [Planctomycetota bacterium]|nr:thiamine pyrophosphate-dependent enzyme [Planctomycetota bacterium]
MTAYLDTTNGQPYCKGCGHPHVLDALDHALQAAGVPPHRIALVTDIGCVGLADAQFPTLHTVHSLHGRAAALATGMQLAAGTDGDEPLKPVVLVGDGGSTIGLLHLVHAAQLDVDVTVLVHNNLIYGMTGGQHSGLTPHGFRTTTTPDGCLTPPLDLGRVLAGAGCGYFARARAPSNELGELLAEGIRRPGFACVEALELCPTFAARIGGMTGKGLREMTSEGGLAMGVLERREPRAGPVRRGNGDPAPALFGAGIAPEPTWSRLQRPVQLVVAGRAGERVQSAAKLAAVAGAAAGLGATLRTDNPVTQGRGFSVAELTLSPEAVRYTGLDRPDIAIATAPEGLAQLAQRGLLAGPLAAHRIVCDESLEPPAEAHVERAPLRKRHGGAAAALGAVLEAVDAAGWFDPRAWEVAIQARPEAQRASVRRTLAKAGVSVRAARGRRSCG